MFHLRLLWLLARNSLIREMMFPANFLIQVVTRLFWFAARIVLFQLIYLETDSIREWSRDEYFAFMATGMLINSLVEAFFMPNCAAFCESIRTGKLDLVLTRPVDAQFLVSLQRINPAMATQTLLAVALLLLSLNRLSWPISAATAGLYVFYVAVATGFFYSLMITTACTSIWFGRNQGLYDFWFYITIFAQYPRSIYDGSDASRFEAGEALQFAFSWIIPILLVVTIPAQTITGTAADPRFATAMLILTLACLLISRRVFLWSLNAYRGASSRHSQPSTSITHSPNAADLRMRGNYVSISAQLLRPHSLLRSAAADAFRHSTLPR
jgi:ABC-2 type transport system permease protein